MAKAREYLVEVDPDFVVLTPPRGSWDRIQVPNRRTSWYMRVLQMKEAEARAVLAFVEEVVCYQHCRGRAVVLENPKRSLLWEQAPIQRAMSSPGMQVVHVDLCVYEKRRLGTGHLVKNSMMFKGTAAVCEMIAATCAGDPEHGYTAGVWSDKQPDGPTDTKLTVAACAVGYTEPLVEKLLAGARQFLEKRRRAPRKFPVGDGDGGVAEEGFMDADETAQDDWSSHELPERARAELYGRIPRETRQAARKAHRGLGNPSKDAFLRMLRLGGATPVAMEYARALDCPVCACCAAPTRPFNKTLGGLGAPNAAWLQQDRVS